MKKRVLLLLITVMFFNMLCGCGAKENHSTKYSIVTTIFPEYDWVMNLLGDQADDVEITILLDNGVDLHSYQPTASDLIKISTCDLFVYVGGESDNWVEDALADCSNPNRIAINLMEMLSDRLKEETVVEGMQGEIEEDENDEHIWLSLNNAIVACDTICNALCTVDEKNADIYSLNNKTYCEELRALDKEYSKTVESASRNVILFGDRFPFRYLTEDYGLNYYAAFTGCSAESEASFETIAFLADKVDQLDIPVVLTLEGSDRKLAETIISTTQGKKAQILSLDSLQSTTAVDISNGASYLAAMEKNLSVLKTALS